MDIEVKSNNNTRNDMGLLQNVKKSTFSDCCYQQKFIQEKSDHTCIEVKYGDKDENKIHLKVKKLPFGWREKIISDWNSKSKKQYELNVVGYGMQ